MKKIPVAVVVRPRDSGEWDELVEGWLEYERSRGSEVVKVDHDAKEIIVEYVDVEWPGG